MRKTDNFYVVVRRNDEGEYPDYATKADSPASALEFAYWNEANKPADSYYTQNPIVGTTEITIVINPNVIYLPGLKPRR